MAQKTAQPSAATGKLVLVGTPIGNLGDISRRALEAFSGADVVCCEDTRVTGKLLHACGIDKPLERLDEAEITRRGEDIIARVAAGETIAFASDAGMPAVSDPGARLVALAREAGVDVDVIPGPSAAVCAYVQSGFTCPRYYFGGFFPRKPGERRETLEALRALDAVLVFYESPMRVVSALKDIAQAWPGREVAVCRELTKLHQEIVRGSAADVAAGFAARGEGIKGEIVLVIDAPQGSDFAQDAATLDDARERAGALIAAGTGAKDARTALMAEFGLSRNDAYDLVLEAQRTALQ